MSGTECIKLFNSDNYAMDVALLWLLSNKWNWGTESSSHLMKVTWLATDQRPRYTQTTSYFNHFIFITEYYPPVNIYLRLFMHPFIHSPLDAHWGSFLLFCYCKHSRTLLVHAFLCTSVKTIRAYIIRRAVAGWKDMNSVRLYEMLPTGSPDYSATVHSY